MPINRALVNDSSCAELSFCGIFATRSSHCTTRKTTISSSTTVEDKALDDCIKSIIQQLEECIANDVQKIEYEENLLLRLKAAEEELSAFENKQKRSPVSRLFFSILQHCFDIKHPRRQELIVCIEDYKHFLTECQKRRTESYPTLDEYKSTVDFFKNQICMLKIMLTSRELSRFETTCKETGQEPQQPHVDEIECRRLIEIISQKFRAQHSPEPDAKEKFERDQPPPNPRH